MQQTLRKLLGTVLIIALAGIYALVATTIASAKLADAGGFVHLIYFLLTGLLWVLPAMWLIKWMMRPDKLPNQESDD